MSDCCNPAGYRHLFNHKEAKRSLRAYEKKGLDKMARAMVDYLKSRGVEGRTVVEAGGGIGAIQLELLAAGAARSINVELSSGYEEVADELIARSGLSGRATRMIGDFTEISRDLEADDVVMNRVICCYPFMERLVDAAISSSRRFFAATFPRDRLLARLVIGIGNLSRRIRGVDFQAFVHSPDQIVATAAASGFDVVFRDGDLMWHAVVFERRP